jgi:outer membrane protein OmpA-like peptidoglycan-associated protein
MILGLALFFSAGPDPKALAQNDSATQWLERDFFEQNSALEESPQPLPPDENSLYPTAQELDDLPLNIEPGPIVYPALAPSVPANQEAQPLPQAPPFPQTSETLPLPPPPVVTRPSGMGAGGESLIEGLDPGPGQAQSPVYVPVDPNYVDQEFGNVDQAQSPSQPETISQPNVEFEPLDPNYVDTEFGEINPRPGETLTVQPTPPPTSTPAPGPESVAGPLPQTPSLETPLAEVPLPEAPLAEAPLPETPVSQAPEGQTPSPEPSALGPPALEPPSLGPPEVGSPLAESSPEPLDGPAEVESAVSENAQSPGGAIESAAVASGDITNLDVGQMVEVLKAQEGAPIGVGDSLFVWQDDTLYRRNPDGSLEPTGSVLSPNDTTFDEEGRSWLTHNEDGSVLINVSLRVWATINFAYNSSEIEPDSEGVLRTFSQALNRPALLNKKLIISGHTDSTGSDLFNMGLSRRRAASVGQWLVENGHLSPDRLILAGYGASMPVSDNETEEGRAINRRVEFILIN